MAHGGGAAFDLVADIGGTNARFALVARERGGTTLVAQRTLATAGFANLQHAAEQYLADVDARPGRAAIAVASPVTGDAIRLTNRAWSFSRAELAAALRLERLVVLNDFGAIARAIPFLAATDRESLHGDPVAPLAGPVSILGPGTGLGVALLVDVARGESSLRAIPGGGASAPIADSRPASPADVRTDWHVVETEGGHITFAAQGDEERTIARWLDARYGRTSNERLLSGAGLSHIDAVLGAQDGGTLPDPRTAPLRDPADIVAAALDGHDRTARRVLARFCAILGSVAADTALIHGAHTVMIAGGIVPRFVPFVRASAFRERFLAKGRFAAWLEGVAIHVVTHPMPGLLGAAAALGTTEPEDA